MKYDYTLDLEGDNPVALFLQRIRPESKVLEFGTSTGYMTQYLAEKLQCSVWGVELDSEAASRAGQYACRMIVADVDSLSWVAELEQERFDYVIFADVLEHLRKPKQALEAVRTFLSPEGVVMISTPNIAHNAVIMQLLQDEFTYRPTGLLDDTHIHFFTRRTLETMLQDVGMKPIEWLTTEVHPEQTEFLQDYYFLPQGVESFLKRRKYGHSYQHIVLCRYEKDSSLARIEVKKGFEPGSVERALQVYWPTEAGHVEAHSSRQSLRQHGEFYTYSFEVPQLMPASIRMDIGAISSFFEIEYVKLFGITGNKEVLGFCADCENQFQGLVPAHDIRELERDNVYRAFSIGFDSQLLLSFAPWTLEQASGYRLEISLRWSGFIPAELVHSLGDLCQRRQDLNEQLQEQCEKEKLYFNQELQRQKEFMTFEIRQQQDVLEKIYSSRGWKVLSWWYRLRERVRSFLP